MTFRAEFMSTKMFRRGFLIAISFRREGYNNNNNNNNNQGFLGLPQGVWKSEFPVGKSFLLRGTEKKTQTLKWSGKKVSSMFRSPGYLYLGNQSMFAQWDQTETTENRNNDRPSTLSNINLNLSLIFFEPPSFL